MMKKFIHASPVSGICFSFPHNSPRKKSPKNGRQRLRTSRIRANYAPNLRTSHRVPPSPVRNRSMRCHATMAADLHDLSPRSQARTPRMKLPKPFFKPLAIGAPEPYRELPVRLERMIHFVPPHLDKIRAKVPELIREVDVVLGNLEDAIPADAKVAARAGFIDMALVNDFGTTGLWTRINALNSPWALDDVTQIVSSVGNKLDVIMLPKVEGVWDIHYLDQLLAQLEARHAVGKPILIHAILETAEGVKNVEAIAAASPRMHGISLGPADLAASRAMKTTRVGGGHPDYVVLADP